MRKEAHHARWAELEALLDDLLDMQQDERNVLLGEIAAEDAELHVTIQRLLAASDSDDSFLDRGAHDLSEDALEDLVGELRAHSEITDPPAGTSSDSDRSLGKYRLLERLGTGGMGEVWLAKRDDDVLQQTVAIKILRPLVGEDSVQRFHRERHILASLQHDGIARILDAGVSPDEPPYLVLEYVEGTEITRYCSTELLSVHDRLRLFVQVCDAVGHAHRRLIVHRDLKPSNILVDTRGQVKLLDFGIAKLLDPSELGAGDAPTRAGLLPMTPEYAAPEQIRGEPITTATDVYGLGTLLYEILSGERPFDTKGLSPAELERLVCDTDPRQPSDAPGASSHQRKALRGDLDTVVLKALAKEPDDRYPSVSHLAADINNYLAGLPVTARPASVAYRARKFFLRHRLALSAAVVAGMTLLTGVGGTLWQGRKAQLQKARFDSTGEFLFTLFEQVDPDLNPGSQLTAVSLLDVGTAQLEKFAAGPEARVDLLRVLGVLYNKLGEHEHGETLLRRAVAEATENLPPENETIGQAMNSLGRILAERGNLEESERVLVESAAAFATAGETERWALGVELDLALTLSLQGRWREAETALIQNVAAHEPLLGDDPRSLSHRSQIQALALLGELQMDLDRWTDSQRSLERATTMAREILGEDHPQLGRGLEALGLLHHRIGDLASSETVLREALNVRRKAHPGGHQSIARILALLATVASEQGEHEEARRLSIESTDSWHRLPEGTHSERANQLRSIASFQLRGGELALALSSQTEALDARRLAHGSSDHWHIADELHQLGLIQLSAGDITGAEDRLTRALEMRQSILGENHSSVGRSLAALGELRLLQNQASAGVELLEQAHKILKGALPPDHPDLDELNQNIARLESGATSPLG